MRTREGKWVISSSKNHKPGDSVRKRDRHKGHALEKDEDENMGDPGDESPQENGGRGQRKVSGRRAFRDSHTFLGSCNQVSSWIGSRITLDMSSGERYDAFYLLSTRTFGGTPTSHIRDA
ncbi:hypothetical protein OG21DRAFT_1527097 [Imleria badia]|nr:hypothetical protein OG21DRAFT_1527097 [Imleria badia]